MAAALCCAGEMACCAAQGGCCCIRICAGISCCGGAPAKPRPGRWKKGARRGVPTAVSRLTAFSAYFLIFAVSVLLAWLLRDYGARHLQFVPGAPRLPLRARSRFG